MMAGIIRPDQGEILIDDLPVYENEEAKKLFFSISQMTAIFHRTIQRWIWYGSTGTFTRSFASSFSMN